jgi:glycosyltransferase involved in cell wall biosynthesis
MQNNDAAYQQAESELRRLARHFHQDVFLTSQYCFGALEIDSPRIIVAHSDVLSWARSCRGLPLEPSPWLTRYCSLVDEGLSGADAVVAPTQWMLEALAEGFSLPDRRCVIPNGRTVPQISAASRRLQAVTVGRLWDEAKNLKMLDGMNLPLPLIVAGATQCEPISSSTTNAARGSGPLKEEALLNLFRCSAIYICPSLYEPFGFAPLEAALCGCAVVANDIPSLREVWHESAVYFTGAQSLTDLLQNLIIDGDLLAEVQNRSHVRARHFSTERMLSGYLGLFNSVSSQLEATQSVA